MRGRLEPHHCAGVRTVTPFGTEALLRSERASTSRPREGVLGFGRSPGFSLCAPKTGEDGEGQHIMAGRSTRTLLVGKLGARVGRWLTTAVVLAAIVAALLPRTGSGPSHLLVHRSHVVATGTAYDWSGLGRTPGHSGTAPNSSIDVGDAGQLGVRWAANLYGPALSSPIVEDVTKLGMTAYVATMSGDFEAYSLSTGALVWGRHLGSDIVSTPIAFDGAIWAETQNPPTLYRLDPATGATTCTLVGTGSFESSLVGVTPPGGVPTVYGASLDNGVQSGPIFAVKASNCATEWTFAGYRTAVTGPWAPMSYAIDGNGTPLVIVGTSDPDDTEYALDALTGAEVWTFAAPTGGDWDIAAGATISAPSVNGFKDGVAYVVSKHGDVFALDLTTGQEIWSYSFGSAVGSAETGRSTPALTGSNLVFGREGGVVDLDAVSGTPRWVYTDPHGTEVLSSVAVAGPERRQVVLCADLGGFVHALALSSGKDLWNYKTGGYVVSSPAISGGDVLVASSDGFLYDMAAGGSNDEANPPATSITFPAAGATLPNGHGPVTLSGTAHDEKGVGSVTVAVEAGAGGPYWDAATGTFSPAPVANQATVESKGSTTVHWRFTLPVPSYGGPYVAEATAYGTDGQPDVHGSTRAFSVAASSAGPRLSESSPFVPMGGTVVISGSGFQPDAEVELSFDGSVFATTTSTGAGVIGPTTLSVPSGSGVFGSRLVTAVSATDEQLAAIPLTVSDSWSDAGGSAAETSYEDDDDTFADLMFLGSDSGMAPAWDLVTGAALSGTPVEAHDVVYTSTADGAVIAANSSDGVERWTWQAPKGGPCSTPAVDARGNRVVVSDSDDVIALTTAGKLAWSVDLAARVGKPVIANGLVIVTTAAGTVVALHETTGSTFWRTQLESAPSSAVAVDTTVHRAFVGEADGTVAALFLGTGIVNWTAHFGAKVSSTPVAVNSTVYAGTAGGELVALSSGTGAIEWSISTGSAVVASPAIGNGRIDVVLADRELLSLEGDGATVLTEHLGCVPTGVSATLLAIFTTCASGELRVYRPAGGPVWQFATGSALPGSAAVCDGAVIVGNADGDLYAFTPYGRAPA